ncbi:MAG: tRNA pseudouridine(55) synthase TruB [Anaerolineae bacterium]
MPESFGFFNVDKPNGLTSHDVVAKIRRHLKLKKVGHAGTLDPLATGVLIICVGGATRLSDYVMHATKVYRARVRLGVTTTTYDSEGDIVQQFDCSHIEQADVEQALGKFLGEIEQIPPMHSAIKVGGRKLYDLARAGEVIERQPRPVRIDSLTMKDWSLPEFTVDVVCSAGTYIRSLVHDIGDVLGVGAHLTGLVRLASSTFEQTAAVPLDTLLTSEHWQEFLIAPHHALAGWPHMVVQPADIEHLRHGRALSQTSEGEESIAFAYDSHDQLIAILQVKNGQWHPHKVFV